MQRFEMWLNQICQQPVWETEWLDMLAQLEYVGCRKLVKNVPFDQIDLERLRHVTEEASHALLLKSVVESRGTRGRAFTEGRLAPCGWEYFQNLDEKISELPGASPPYAAVSWAVEQRVLQVYPLYAATTRDARVRRVIDRITAQETRHGEQFHSQLFDAEFVERATALEQKLWDQLVNRLWAVWEGGHAATRQEENPTNPPRALLQ